MRRECNLVCGGINEPLVGISPFDDSGTWDEVDTRWPFTMESRLFRFRLQLGHGVHVHVHVHHVDADADADPELSSSSPCHIACKEDNRLLASQICQDY